MAQLEQISFNGQTFNVNRVAAGTGIGMVESGGVQTLSGDAAWTKQQAIAAPLTGLNTSLTGNITASDTVLSAMGKVAGNTARQNIDWQTIVGEYIDMNIAKVNGLTFINFASCTVKKEIPAPSMNLTLFPFPSGFSASKIFTFVVGIYPFKSYTGEVWILARPGNGICVTCSAAIPVNSSFVGSAVFF